MTDYWLNEEIAETEAELADQGYSAPAQCRALAIHQIMMRRIEIESATIEPGVPDIFGLLMGEIKLVTADEVKSFTATAGQPLPYFPQGAFSNWKDAYYAANTVETYRDANGELYIELGGRKYARSHKGVVLMEQNGRFFAYSLEARDQEGVLVDLRETVPERSEISRWQYTYIPLIEGTGLVGSSMIFESAAAAPTPEHISARERLALEEARLLSTRISQAKGQSAAAVWLKLKAGVEVPVVSDSAIRERQAAVQSAKRNLKELGITQSSPTPWAGTLLR